MGVVGRCWSSAPTCGGRLRVVAIAFEAHMCELASAGIRAGAGVESEADGATIFGLGLGWCLLAITKGA